MLQQLEQGIRKQIVEVFRAHTEGLSHQVRFDRYRMEGESPEHWIGMLGPDALGLTHPKITSQIVDDFIAYNERNGVTLTPNEQTMLRTAPWIHDFGELHIEGLGVGDVSYDLKTDHDEATESQIFHLILDTINNFPDQQFFENVFHEVAKNPETKLGKMFNAIERVGYLFTAIRVFTGINGSHIINAKGLVGNVLQNQIEALLTYKEEYAYIRHVLDENADVISNMFGDVLAGSDTPIDKNGKQCFDRDRLAEVSRRWSEVYPN